MAGAGLRYAPVAGSALQSALGDERVVLRRIPVFRRWQLLAAAMMIPTSADAGGLT
jgi:hypothetical protein